MYATIAGGLGVAVSYQDFQLWRRWIDLYLYNNAAKIEEMVDRFLEVVATNCEELESPNLGLLLLRNRTKTPYLLLQFDTPFLQGTFDTVHVVDEVHLKRVVQPKRYWEGTGIVEKAVDTWWSGAVSADKVLIVAIFPRNYGFTFAYQQVVDFPFRRSIEGGEGGQQFWLRKKKPFEPFEKDVLEMAQRKVTTSWR